MSDAYDLTQRPRMQPKQPGAPVPGMPLGGPMPKGTTSDRYRPLQPMGAIPSTRPGAMNPMNPGTKAPKGGSPWTGAPASAPPGTAYGVRSAGPPPPTYPNSPAGGNTGLEPWQPPPPSPTASRPMPAPGPRPRPQPAAPVPDGTLPRPTRPSRLGRVDPVEGAGEVPGLGPTPERPNAPVAPPPPPGSVVPPSVPHTPYPPQQRPPTITEPIEPIDPGAPDFADDLRGNVYAPGEDPRLARAGGQTDAALARITGGPGYGEAAAGAEDRYRSLFGTGGIGARDVDTSVDGGPGVDAADGGRYLADQDAAVAGLGGPNRTELAKQAAADIRAAGAEDLEKRFRKVGQSAAKFGRIGSGMVTTELGDLQSDYERNLMRSENDLARSVAEGDISDRFRRVDATSGLRRGESGIESGLRGEARGERDYFTGVDERNVGRALDDRDYRTGVDVGNEDRSFTRARSTVDYGGRDADRDIQDRYDQYDASANLEDRVFGQGQRNREEYRTERGYQQGAGQQSLDNRIRERELQQRIKSDQIARAIALQNAGGRVPSLDSLLA